MDAKAVALLVIVDASRIVVKDPAAVLGPARLVHQEADLVGLALPDPAHPAILAVLAPKRHVDIVLGIERGDEFITVPRGALGELLGAGKIEPDTLERVGQCGHRRISVVDSSFRVV